MGVVAVPHIDCYNLDATARSIARSRARGQVAQLVERSPEKAGVGGSTPSLATMFSITYKPLIPHLRSKTFQFVTAQLLVRAAFPPHVSATRGMS